jgi:outer membrane protein TolC
VKRLIAHVLAACLVADAAFAGQSPGSSLTLEDALAAAAAANRPLKAAQIAATRAGDEIEVMRTKRLPVLDVKSLFGTLLAPFTLTFPAGSLGTYPPIGPIPFEDTDVTSPARPVTTLFFTAAQPLTQLRRVGLGTKVAEAERDIANEEVRRQRLEVATSVKKVYYGLLQARSARTTIDEAGTLLAELQRVVNEYEQREAVLPADRLAVDARIAELELQRVTVSNTIASLSEQMNVLLGRDVLTSFDVVMPSAVAEPDAAGALARAAEARPEVREADLKAQQAGFNVRLKQEAFVPDVSVMASYLGLYNVDIVPQHTASVGLFVTWEPFDWGRRKLEKQSAQHLADAAELARTEARERVRADVNARQRRLVEARAALHVADANARLAGERLRVARERLSQQAALVKDVLEAQVGATEAAQRRQQAELALWTAIADLEQAIGDTAP